MLFAHSFLGGMALIFFEITANTMFLTHLGVLELPYIYIVSALIMVASGYGYTHLEARLESKKLLIVALGCVLLILIGVALLVALSDSVYISMAMMILKGSVWMVVGMGFGALRGIISTTTQSKRLFGVAMLGEMVAGIVGGLSVGFVLHFMDIANLLVISIIALLLSMVVLWQTMLTFSHRFESLPAPKPPISIHKILSNNYYLLFLALFMVAFCLLYAIDYIFYYWVEQTFGNPQELASFFGLFVALLSTLHLIVSLFVSSKIVSRLGVLLGLLVAPLVALIGGTSLVAIALTSLGFAFFVAVTLKLVYGVSHLALLTPTLKTISQSISLQTQMMALSQRVIEPLAMGVVGVILLVVTRLESITIVYGLLIVAAFVSIFVSKRLKAHYAASIEAMLQKREALREGIVLERAMQNLFVENLKSPDELEVIYSLDSLIKMQYPNREKIVVEFIHHPSKRVRLYLLDLIWDTNIDHLAQIVEERIEVEKESEVLYRLFELYCKIACAEAIELVSEYLHHRDPLLQEGALIAMLQYGGVDGILKAGGVLNELFASTKKEHNLLALTILSKMATPSFHAPLEEALNSHDEDLKRIAIMATGNLAIKKFIPYLLSNLELPPYRSLSTMALSKFGANIFEQLSSYFESSKDIDVRLALVRVFATMRTRQAHLFLLSYAYEPLLFDEIIHRLFDCDFVCNDEAKVIELLGISTQYALYCATMLERLDKQRYPNSYRVVEEIKNQKIDSLFFLLGFLYSKGLITQARIGYTKGDSDKQAYALEVIDNVASAAIQEIVISPLKSLMVKHPDSKMDKHEEQKEFIERVLSDETLFAILKLSIIYEIGVNRDKTYLEPLEKLQTHSNSDIAQTAQWSIKQLHKG